MNAGRDGCWLTARSVLWTPLRQYSSSTVDRHYNSTHTQSYWLRERGVYMNTALYGISRSTSRTLVPPTACRPPPSPTPHSPPYSTYRYVPSMNAPEAIFVVDHRRDSRQLQLQSLIVWLKIILANIFACLTKKIISTQWNCLVRKI